GVERSRYPSLSIPRRAKPTVRSATSVSAPARSSALMTCSTFTKASLGCGLARGAALRCRYGLPEQGVRDDEGHPFGPLRADRVEQGRERKSEQQEDGIVVERALA